MAAGSSDSPPGGLYLIKTDSLGWAGCQEYYYPIAVNAIFPTDSNIVETFDTGAVVLSSNLTDTTFAVQTYDGCLLNNIPHFDFNKSKSYAYPNPSNGQVKIKSSEAINKNENYITVYDSMGRIITQKAINKEEDKQLDLSKQGKGIYLIKITEGDKVSESKVVVE
jgi:hypothetical protein